MLSCATYNTTWEADTNYYIEKSDDPKEMEILSQELKEMLQAEVQSIICKIKQHDKLLDLIANKSCAEELSIAIKIGKLQKSHELD
jgi:hypothetical protein